MAHEFCTLFDSNYLLRGLALHASLQRLDPASVLRVFCMDDRVHELLSRLSLPGLTPVPLDDLESHDPELAAVKSGRTRVEYCWTATPCIARYCLETEPELEAITYIDADIFFFADPEPLFAERGDGSTQIVPHRYAPEHEYLEETSGIYNVEWVTFKRDERGSAALDWWRERRLEWCYYRVEDGKLGDQKYLDDWPTRFQGVSVLQNIGGGVAPWNVSRYTVHGRGEGPWVDEAPVIFYHYHSLRLYEPTARVLGVRAPRNLRACSNGALLWSSEYPRSSAEESLIWDPYIDELSRALETVRTIAPGFSDGLLSARDLTRRTVEQALHNAHARVDRLRTLLRDHGVRARGTRPDTL